MWETTFRKIVDVASNRFGVSSGRTFTHTPSANQEPFALGVWGTRRVFALLTDWLISSAKDVIDKSDDIQNVRNSVTVDVSNQIRVWG